MKTNLLFFYLLSTSFLFGQLNSNDGETSVYFNTETALTNEFEALESPEPIILKLADDKPLKNINEILTTELLKLRLEALNYKTPFNVEHNATIERFIRLYLKTRKNEISNLMDKANYYFPIFEEHLDKYDLPLEIKYLAIVESALKPNAKSSFGATGLWQFMYHTGKEYGLNVSSYIDERTDPIKATEAACKYLKDLHNRFGDWELALAAYNSGPGNVSKAIRRSGGLRNYWNIRKFLPPETRGYLPAFYSTYYLFEYGADHAIYPKNMEISFLDTDTVHVKKKLTFSKIIQEVGIDKDLLSKLNPQYRLKVIPTSKDAKHILTLPKSHIALFVSKERAIYDLPPRREPAKHIIAHKQNSYVVQLGDNLQRIARKFNTTSPQLKEWNGLQTDYVIEGQSLVINSQKSTATMPSSFAEASPNNVQKESGQVYTTYEVKDGESLFMISKKFENITINEIRNWNNMWGISHLEPGTKLKILTKNK